MFRVAEDSWRWIESPYPGVFPCFASSKPGFLTGLVPCYAFWLVVGLLVIAVGAGAYIAWETGTPWLGWDLRRRQRWRSPGPYDLHSALPDSSTSGSASLGSRNLSDGLDHFAENYFRAGSPRHRGRGCRLAGGSQSPL